MHLNEMFRINKHVYTEQDAVKLMKDRNEKRWSALGLYRNRWLSHRISVGLS